MDTEIRQIIEDLTFIKNEISDIKRNMPDKEMFLTSDESKLLEQSFISENEGKLTSIKDIRKKHKI
ncbi:MAG: hypothetical protein V1859_04015 [archaeon]